MTDGNLATYLRVLEAAGYVSFQKDFIGRRPCTTYAATERGRQALAGYARAMAHLLASLPEA